MTLMKIINFLTGEIREEDVPYTDSIVGPATMERFFLKRWEDFIDIYEDGESDTVDEKEAKILERMNLVTRTDDMTLTQLKKFWKKKVKGQADDAWGDEYTDFKTDKAIAAGVGSKTATKFVNWSARLDAYDTALDNTLATIDACTTKDQVKAISFVAPA